MAGLSYLYNGQIIDLSGPAYTSPPPSALRLKVRTGSGDNDIVDYGLTSNTSASIYSPRLLINGSQLYIGRTEHQSSTRSITTSTEYQTGTRASTSSNATFLARQLYTLFASTTNNRKPNEYYISTAGTAYTKYNKANSGAAYQIHFNTSNGKTYSTMTYEIELESSQGSLTSTLGCSCEWSATGWAFKSNDTSFMRGTSITSKGVRKNLHATNTFVPLITNDTSNAVVVEWDNANNVHWLRRRVSTYAINKSTTRYYIHSVVITYFHSSLPRITQDYTRTSQYTSNTIYHTTSQSYTIEATTQNFIT